MSVRFKNTPAFFNLSTYDSFHYANNGCIMSGGILTDSVGNTALVSSGREWMQGWSVPGWRRMRNEGQILPFTPFKHFKYDSRHNGDGVYLMCWGGSGKLYSQTDGGKYAGNGNWIGHNKVSVLDYQSLLDIFDIEEPDPSYEVQKAAARIASQGFDALTFIAEIKSLRNMLQGVLQKVERLTRGLKPGEIHNLWLEGRYGWRTLMYDIRDLQEAIESLEDKRTRYNQKVGSKYTLIVNRYGEDPSAPHVRYWSETLTANVSLRGSVVADIEVPTFQFNPLTTFWEVTKLSFVVDWLFNVGQALDAFTFLALVKSYQAAGGYRIDFQTSGSVGVATAGPGVANFSGSYTGSGFYKRRFPQTVDPSPRVKLRLDPLKIVDLVALILQRL